MKTEDDAREEASQEAAADGDAKPTEGGAGKAAGRRPRLRRPRGGRRVDWAGARAGLIREWRSVAAVAMLAVGVLFVMLGWYGAAHTNIFTEQIPYLISGGLLGLGLIVVAGFLVGVTSLERENRQLRSDLADALTGLRSGDGLRLGRTEFPGEPGGNGHVYVVPGGRSFHVAGCPILEGKDGVKELERGRATRTYAPCKLCGPD